MSNILEKIKAFIRNFKENNPLKELYNISLNYEEYHRLRIEVNSSLRYSTQSFNQTLPIKVFGIDIIMGKESDLQFLESGE